MRFEVFTNTQLDLSKIGSPKNPTGLRYNRFNRGHIDWGRPFSNSIIPPLANWRISWYTSAVSCAVFSDQHPPQLRIFLPTAGLRASVGGWGPLRDGPFDEKYEKEWGN